MKTYAFITGNNFQLSLEELLVVLEPLGFIIEVNKRFLIFQGEIDPGRVLERLGGTVKIGQVIKRTEKAELFTLDDWVHALRSGLNGDTGRINFGLSIYSQRKSLYPIFKRRGLELKKYFKSIERSSRFIFNNDGILSSVAVTKNKLLGNELMLLEGQQFYFAITEQVQHFEAYSKRDFGRPSRNMRRGMLPPKVAQIMLNLGHVQDSDRLLDPFCGGGTIIQEALIRGLSQVYGSDNDAQAITETKKNIAWLSDHYNIAHPNLAVADVFSLEKEYKNLRFHIVVTEPFLGSAQVLKKQSLTRDTLYQIRNDLERLYLHLFEELREIVYPQAKLVIIFPIFRLFGDEITVGSIPSFERAGWHLLKPRVSTYIPEGDLSSRGQLVYSRDDQIVAREIMVWERNGDRNGD